MAIKLKGMDVSYWQDTIDFDKVKKDGIEFVIARSSYRHTPDLRFPEYVKECKRVGIPIIGVYHFSYALNVAQATSEAKFCLEQLEKAGLSKDTFVFFDFEYDTVKKAKASGVILTRTDCNAHAKAFCEYVEKQGYKAGIYCNIDYYENWYDKDLLNRYIVWLADLSGACKYPCVLHQYTGTGSVEGINGDVDLDYYYMSSFDKKETTAMQYSRNAVVDLARSWKGKNEADGSYKEIIDIYNSYEGTLPRSVKMEYGWAWCACFWSALAIKLGYTSIMPIEISCPELITRAQKMGCWVENDAYVPNLGDGVLYDWEDSGIGDNTGVPDHIGVVIYVNEDAGYMVVMEGNYSDSVKERTISINGRYIRGFITPAYTNDGERYPVATGDKSVDQLAHEVIAGMWGNGDERKARIEYLGYDYSAIQTRVNEILNGSATTGTDGRRTQPTTKQVMATCYAQCFKKEYGGEYKVTANSGLYLRNDAGTNKKALALLPKGAEVICYGFYSYLNGIWLYVEARLDGVVYTGFCSKTYLKKK